MGPTRKVPVALTSYGPGGVSLWVRGLPPIRTRVVICYAIFRLVVDVACVLLSRLLRFCSIDILRWACSSGIRCFRVSNPSDL
ncbi:hypothetical protein B296_00033997 [Ensete ventricosum]|uniref:Uncharacterized protein n=1 Tax=Ensete ventricosum TaxID=4639 RepID=A0A427A9K8_ENSVE|nr:hypothetical protein B296_00033997 [Ensete ventricosum]